MRFQSKPQQIDSAMQKHSMKSVQGEYVTLLGEPYYKIHHYDMMDPFFMSIVSSSDHWLFLSSTGGLTAGRSSAEKSVFPYYSVDKITENFENTGPKAILHVRRSEQAYLWEPFSNRQQGVYTFQRNLYKNITGTALIFEETNNDLGLVYRYAWRTSEAFGFVKTTWLENKTEESCQVDLLDGIQNILPANVSSQTQNVFSSLLDAYKRSELHEETGLAIYTLSSRLTDLAEPSESLLATTVAQVGVKRPTYLLTATQLEGFRWGEPVQLETDIRGLRGAYFLHTSVDLAPQAAFSWHLIADTAQDAAAVAQKIQWLRGNPAVLAQEIEEDIAAGQARLWEIVAGADGIQVSNNNLVTTHHFANVMFNLMRGGTFADQYQVQGKDFAGFVSLRNRPIYEAHLNFFNTLPDKIHIKDLLSRAEASESLELVRLSYAYLPLTFSRRHGDPSRPWNRFAINIKQPDGSQKLDYEGNWRDIFQNWEVLAYSYPEYVESMISTFLNATTVDGYNPYRITHHGIDWEAPEPGNPWANIGYWSDHQIIYLLKLMEISRKFHPGRLQGFLNRMLYTYANVPYRIKHYPDLLKNPYNTIDFNWELEKLIETRVKEHGSDGKLVYKKDGLVLQTSLAEKLLTLLLAKLANFVPEGGIWMNTQRPEWNDANNALVGKGLSVVTLCYLRRYITFMKDLLSGSETNKVSVSVEVAQFFTRVQQVLIQYQPILSGSFSDQQRRSVLDDLGEAGSAFRWNFYTNGLSGSRREVPIDEMLHFLDLTQQYVEHSLRANRRGDRLYHAYNILHISEDKAGVTHLYEMLEGQVAILSSGLLDADETLDLLDSLRNSALFQASTHTYILYPDRDLPGFLEKNCLTWEQVAGIPLLTRLIEAKDKTVITRDVLGAFHFHGEIRNVVDLNKALEMLKSRPEYSQLVDADQGKILALFEDTFHHNEFTGRSGTFFAYEGLGSVYWHMVAKLLLAVQENALRFKQSAHFNALMNCYQDVRLGLGFNKSPESYGAFPTDPYSHTPKDQGAKQPGMTGMVKEEVLTRQTELGYSVENGRLEFAPFLTDASELLAAPVTYTYLDLNGKYQQIQVQAGSLAYSICQTPVILRTGKTASINIQFADGTSQQVTGSVLDAASSTHIFQRDGAIACLTVTFVV